MFRHDITLTGSYLFYAVQKQPQSLPVVKNTSLLYFDELQAHHCSTFSRSVHVFKSLIEGVASWPVIPSIVFHATCHVIINITFSFFRCFVFCSFCFVLLCVFVYFLWMPPQEEGNQANFLEGKNERKNVLLLQKQRKCMSNEKSREFSHSKYLSLSLTNARNG